jgi:hypothetical protein
MPQSWPGERPGDRDLYIGSLGEAFAFGVLANHLTGFDTSCWRSREDCWAIDLEFIDAAGEFAGSDRKGVRCLIDVKATPHRQPKYGPIISDRQWRRARVAHRTPGELFVIIWVWDVRKSPKYDIWMDPVELVLEKKLVMSETPEGKLSLKRP